MDEHTQRRRARLRARTTAEIKETALRLLAEGGPDAISLRAIAREMGMSGSAVYGYFATRDALLRELINDVYASVLDRVEAARDAVPADDTGGRIAAWGLALREWALANPTGFRLIYGDVAATVQAGSFSAAAKRACVGLTELVAAAWPHVRDGQAEHAHEWSDFAATSAAVVQEALPGLDPGVFGLALRVWGRMHGLISLEVNGHLGPQLERSDKLYRAEMLDLVRSLGLSPRALPVVGPTSAER
ncbi:TetR/AcrR family transcriptional regulator [Goodfellowiella coeruleoviolacea]|uniref:Transcriptional regulator, TetR family n=1 Tax=Goodfellowiella coeruleoviolacea TaxID=334858 RepID=A0AAE3GHL6_9PSEU|nr:TetR/AcrR family transcriptional regulator [Goodfellowiella coeruleoviolacea]MCP2166273.1 transcriptional regulator, TetR family [Goodfellowiella coeruleoviolacea]